MDICKTHSQAWRINIQFNPAYDITWVTTSSSAMQNKVDQTELLDILAEAVDASNGWKRILSRCSTPKQTTPRPALTYVAE